MNLPRVRTVSIRHGDEFGVNCTRLLSTMCTQSLVLVGELDSNQDREVISSVIRRYGDPAIDFVHLATMDLANAQKLDPYNEDVFPNYDSMWFYLGPGELPQLPIHSAYSPAMCDWPRGDSRGVLELQEIIRWMEENRVWGCVLYGYYGLSIELER